MDWSVYSQSTLYLLLRPEVISNLVFYAQSTTTVIQLYQGEYDLNEESSVFTGSPSCGIWSSGYQLHLLQTVSIIFSPLTLSQRKLAERKEDRPGVDCSPARPQCNHGVWMDLPKRRVCIWWNLCTLYLPICQVRFTVWDSGLCRCIHVTSFEGWLAPFVCWLPKWSRPIQSCICFSLSCKGLWVSKSTVYIFCIIYLRLCDTTFLLLLVNFLFIENAVIGYISAWTRKEPK